jgi:hypothetical protein
VSRGFFIFSRLFESFFSNVEHTRTLARRRAFAARMFFLRRSLSVFTLSAQPRIPSSLWCCPPNISSILTDHDEVFELPGYPGRAGRLINRPVTIRTIRDFKHSRTGYTALLLLPATTELFVINLIS